MHITNGHLNFWRDRKAPAPGWAKALKNPNASRVAGIHHLINEQDPRYRFRCSEPGNTIAILKMARRRGDLLPLLIEMARRPGPGLKDLMVKRYHYALRWLRRYRRVRASERG